MIVNADDLGMTHGVNRAIFKGYDDGCITHASIMANGDSFDDAINGAIEREGLGIGLHLDITYGKAIIEDSLYCDSDGYFKLEYKDLIFRKDSQFLLAVEREWDAQISLVLSSLPQDRILTHIDSHRHIHIIPHLYPIAVKLAKRYNIERVRLIKEDFIDSMRIARRFNFILNKGIIKYTILKLFTMLNLKQEDLYGDRRFYSILYTGVVDAEIIKRVIESKKRYEIMVHPGYPHLEKDTQFYDEEDRDYRISDNRMRELEAVLSIKRDDIK
ncbi:Cellobiose phosphotransferase system YdjC-like protein [hydrothermal vent metagenome]|uniref:Cellobiose phosphotransferase system YdjC-like protein n=1 Tax=hydrothermal vent metagenome TaxID=652676 RepID=A0A1W1B9N8_9ZZZZ